MCSPRTDSQFQSPAQSSPTGRAQQACHHARERERFVDGRFHGGAPAWWSMRLTALRFAWYWNDPPRPEQPEIQDFPHEPPKRCGLTPANLGVRSYASTSRQ